MLLDYGFPRRRSAPWEGGCVLKCVLRDIGKFDHEGIRQLLEPVKVYVQDSHFSRKLFRCRECGQLYLYVFNEEVDYAGGNDAMYFRYIPVDDEAAAERLSKAPQFELEARYGIHLDWPSDEDAQRPPYWANLPGPP